MGRGLTFSREFKRAVGRQVVGDEQRPAQVCREHSLAAGLLLRWRREYTERGEAAFGPPEATSTVALERSSGRAGALLRATGAGERGAQNGADHAAGAARHAIIAAMRAAAPALSSRRLCDLVGAGRTWDDTRPSPAEVAQRDTALRAAIERLALALPGDGYRRVTAALRRDGWDVTHTRVLRVMRTTDSAHARRPYPNLLTDAVPSGPDQAGVADITSIRLPTTFADLACVLDAWSRRCVGWEFSRTIDTTLTLTARDRALTSRRPATGVLHHSDRGVQYCNTPAPRPSPGCAMRVPG